MRRTVTTESPSPHQARIDAAIAGDLGAERRLRDALKSAADSDERSALLDPLALSAAGGSRSALGLVLWAVDELRLPRPAIRRLLIDDADVDEASQDVLVAVAQTIHGFRGDARFTTWLHQVARFKAIALLRRKQQPAAELAADDLMGDAQRISSMIATRVSVADIVRELPDTYREAVLLRDVEQLPYDAIAERLDLNLNTVKTRVARGRALVAAQLGER